MCVVVMRRVMRGEGRGVGKRGVVQGGSERK